MTSAGIPASCTGPRARSGSVRAASLPCTITAHVPPRARGGAGPGAATRPVHPGGRHEPRRAGGPGARVRHVLVGRSVRRARVGPHVGHHPRGGARPGCGAGGDVQGAAHAATPSALDVAAQHPGTTGPHQPPRPGRGGRPDVPRRAGVGQRHATVARRGDGEVEDGAPLGGARVHRERLTVDLPGEVPAAADHHQGGHHDQGQRRDPQASGTTGASARTGARGRAAVPRRATARPGAHARASQRSTAARALWVVTAPHTWSNPWLAKGSST